MRYVLTCIICCICCKYFGHIVKLRYNFDFSSELNAPEHYQSTIVNHKTRFVREAQRGKDRKAI